MQTQSFPTTISARDIQRGYKKIFDKVKKTKRPIVVMANNQPQGAIVSLEMLEEYNKVKAEQNLFEIIEKVQAKNKDKDPDKVLKDVTETVETVRQEMYERSVPGIRSKN